MGVEGLTGYVRHRVGAQCLDRIDLTETAREQGLPVKLAVDGPALLYLFMRRHDLDLELGGNYAALRDALKDYINKLRAAKVELVVVFDGLPEPLKADTADKRREQQAKKAQVVRNLLGEGQLALQEYLATEALPLPLFAVDVMQRVLEQLGVCWTRALGEGDSVVAAVCNSSSYHCLAVLTNDSDFYILDVPGTILIENLHVNGGQAWADVFRRNRLAQHLHLREGLLPTLACLSGNDHFRLPEDVRSQWRDIGEVAGYLTSLGYSGNDTLLFANLFPSSAYKKKRADARRATSGNTAPSTNDVQDVDEQHRPLLQRFKAAKRLYELTPHAATDSLSAPAGSHLGDWSRRATTGAGAVSGLSDRFGRCPLMAGAMVLRSASFHILLEDPSRGLTSWQALGRARIGLYGLAARLCSFPQRDITLKAPADVTSARDGWKLMDVQETHQLGLIQQEKKLEVWVPRDRPHTRHECWEKAMWALELMDHSAKLLEVTALIAVGPDLPGCAPQMPAVALSAALLRFGNIGTGKVKGAARKIVCPACVLAFVMSAVIPTTLLGLLQHVNNSAPQSLIQTFVTEWCFTQTAVWHINALFSMLVGSGSESTSAMLLPELSSFQLNPCFLRPAMALALRIHLQQVCPEQWECITRDSMAGACHYVMQQVCGAALSQGWAENVNSILGALV